MDRAEKCTSLGDAPILFRLRRLIGEGSTGIVYEARLFDNGIEDESRAYALKFVYKRTRSKEEVRDREVRLRKEFSVYLRLEEARHQDGIDGIAPRCYGLFESDLMMILVLDYGCDALKGDAWSMISSEVEKYVVLPLKRTGGPKLYRKRLFDMLRRLHIAGVIHGDFEPRNVVRDSAGCLKIIDFSSSVMHKCPDIKAANVLQQRPDNHRGGIKDRFRCGELRNIWRQLFK